MKKLISLLGIILLSGCAAIDRSWHTSSSYEKALRTLSYIPNVKPSDWSMENLTCDAWGSEVFHASCKQFDLVIKIFSHLTEAERIAYTAAYNVASINNYCPSVYFSHPELGMLIMRYATPQEFNFDRIHIDLGHLLFRIHNGPAFGTSETFMARMRKMIAHTNAIYKARTLLEATVAQTTLPEACPSDVLPVSTDQQCPCHGNINLSNVIMSDGQLYITDFDCAGLGDKYVDIAAGAVFYCMNDPKKINEFFTVCLGHTPTPVEKTKLAIAIRFTLIFQASRLLRQTHKDTTITLPATEHNETYAQCIMRLLKDRSALHHDHEKIHLANLMIQEALA